VESDFTFAFLTDIHIQPERGAAEAFTRCLRHVEALQPRADFILTGGDLIMDGLDVPLSRAEMEYGLLMTALQDCTLPMHHVIGNHDIIGWSSKAVVAPEDAWYGKRMFAEKCGGGRTYRSFDHQGWHFILLDSVGQNKETRDYYGHIDEEQMQWLRGELAAVGKNTPIIVVTHIPFVSVWHQYLLGGSAPAGPKGLVQNANEVIKLMSGYNVKLVLSGHGHILEHIQINETLFLQGGAVSGMWWKGPVHGRQEGYCTIRCCADGGFSYAYQDYGWDVRG
jgi:3',5'-cyclic AMP phosphodiesterase CpdA